MKAVLPILYLGAVVWLGFSAQAQNLGEPLAASWPSPAALLNYNPTNDPDANYNRSSLPLAPRISNPALNINPHARNNEARVMPLVSFNSGVVPSAQGSRTNRFYAGNYWQYMDTLVSWGGSPGMIHAPFGHVIDAAHRNGVQIMGMIFFAPGVYGGQISNLNTFVQKVGSTFPVADKMIEVARYHGFDGWFINAETEGANSTTAAAMRDLLIYWKAKAPDVKVVWYDAMNESGSVGWQGAFNTANDAFMYYNGAKVSDTMFIDFRWSSSSLTSSRALAQSYGLNPYDFYTGIDTEGSGSSTTVAWTSIFPEGAPHKLSLGIYRPEQTFNYAGATLTNFYARDNVFWVGPGGDPAATSSNNVWPGIAHFIPASSPITTVPFATSFNPGQGNFYNVAGQPLMNGGWNNLGLQDVLPTWRWRVVSAGTKLTPSLDFADAYNGGASLLVTGTLSATNDVWLYQTSLAVSNNTNFRLVYKTGAAGATANMKLALAFEDSPGAFQYFDVSNTVTAGWNTNVFSLSAHAGRKIAVIGLRFAAASTVSSYSMRVGQMAVYHGALSVPAAPTGIAIDRQYNLGWTNYALRLTWTRSTDPAFCYNVYRRNPDNSRTWIWGTPNNAVFIPSLMRLNNEAFTPIEIETVGLDGGVSASGTYNFVWINPMTVPLMASDGAGESSFDSGLNWSNSIAPAATNIHLVAGFDLRSPEVNSDLTFQGGALVLTNGGALRLRGTGSGKVITIGGGPGASLSIGNGTVSDWANLPQTLDGFITLQNGGGVFEPQTTTLTVSSMIGGNGSLVVDSPSGVVGGTVVLSGVNTYTGGTILNAANTLRLSGSGTLGAGSSLTFSNTAGRGWGFVDLNGMSQSVNNLSGVGGVIANNGGSGNATFTIGVSNGTGGVFRGAILDRTSGSGTITLAKAGSGAITLAGPTNVCSGGLSVSGGTLLVTNNAALTVGNGSGASLAIASGSLASGSLTGTLDVSASSNFTANVGTIQVGITTAGGGTPTVLGGLKLGTNNSLTASSSVVFGDMGNAYYTGVQSISTAPNGMTTMRTPSLTVGGSKGSATFTLGAGARLNLGTNNNRTAVNVGVSPQGGSGSYTGTFDVSGGVFKGYLSSLTLGQLSNGGNGNETGLFTIGANPANHLDLTGSGNVMTIARFVSGSGVGKANGTVTINNLDATSVVTSTDNSTAILIGATANSIGTLNLNGGTLTIKSAGPAIAGGAGTSTLNLGGVTLRAGANSVSFITNVTTANLTSAGPTLDATNFNITVAQAFAGTGGLTKLGAGNLTLSKANTYSGNTTVGAGTLALSEAGAIANSVAVTVSNAAVLDVLGRADQTLTLSSGKTLRGGGSVLGKLNTLAGSTVNPGDGIGTLTVQSNITLAGALLMELNRTNAQTSDRLLSGSGTITASGVLTVANLGPALQAGDSFQLFSPPVSGFGNVILPGVAPTLAWTNRLAQDGTIAVVPAFAMNETNINALVTNGTLLLSWPDDHTGWQLQVQTNALTTGLGTNWLDVMGTEATNQIAFPIGPEERSVFFRLKLP